MSPRFITSPFTGAFDLFARALECDGILCSPYIALAPVEKLMEELNRRQVLQTVRLLLMTDLSVPNIVQGATDLNAVLALASAGPGMRVVHRPRLHAKAYVADDALAIVTSANFTTGGAVRNLEYGVCCQDVASVRCVRADMRGYADLGAVVANEQLVGLRDQANTLIGELADERKMFEKTTRLRSAALGRQLEESLLRERVRGRSINALFADTIVSLLGRGPLTTVELHQAIQGLHPDICDDSMDRVIDGQHFGKLWKHQVRNAQQHLKGSGRIERGPGGHWRLLSPDR